MRSKDFKLSYSSSNLLLGCEKKYWHHKVNKTVRDKDSTFDTLPLDIGSALHYCLEHCHHNLAGFTPARLNEVLNEYPSLNFEEHGPLVWAMLKKYKVLHEQVGATAELVELALEDESFVGYVDIVLKDKDGGYWLSDLKTAATASPFLSARLPNDRQLNIYVAKAIEVYKDAEWVKNLKGCKYRLVTKSKAKRRKNEDFKEYSDSLFDSIKALEYEIPLEIMDYKTAGEEFKGLVRRRDEILAGAEPTRNFNFCETYFKPCEWWSQCHGQTFSSEPKVRVVEA